VIRKYRIFYCAALIYAFLSVFVLQAGAADVVDHRTYSTLLEKYVVDGRVDYLGWKEKDLAIFEQYIKSLDKASLNGLSTNERKAFWVNAYNALTIYAVLRHIPANGLLARVFSVQMVPGFFDKLTYAVAGEELTLNDIENRKLRAAFGDPRIHFVLVCASRSCPKIENTPLEGTGLDERLDSAARNFIQDISRNRLDQKSDILYLSEIFKWYDSDFIASAGTAIDFVKRYIEKEEGEYLSGHKVQTKYLFYDWLVNIAK
jgi:hypothetical protein